MKVAGSAFLRLLGGIAIACCLMVAATAQEEISIKIARIAGTVEVQDTAVSDQWAAATAKQKIGPGWRLRTAAESKVQLVFPMDNVVILKENSVLYVDNLDAGGGAKLGADEGSLLVDIRNALAPGSEFELQTPTALAVVRGTKYGADEIDEYDVSFYGYGGNTEIFGIYGQGPVFLTAGNTVDVAYGNAPGNPYPSSSAADGFLEDAEDESGFVEVEVNAENLAGRLEAIERDLDEIVELLTDIEREWDRYERNDQVTQLTFLYAQILNLQGQTDEQSGIYFLLLDQVTELGLPVDIDPVPGLIESIEFKLNQILERIGRMAEEAAGIVIDDEDLLEQLRGLIKPGDPSLGLRWGLIDSDGDGVSDLDEIALGLDPLSGNDDGFIELVAPDDGDEIEFPDTTVVGFEFEELDTDFVESYNLILQSGGIEWQRRGVDSMEDVDLLPLLVEGGAFADQIDDDGVLELDWFVTADIEQNQLFQQIASTNPGFNAGFGNTVSSEIRQLIVNTPVQQDVVILDLDNVGSTTVQAGQRIRIRGMISEVVAMAEWEIEVIYDSSMLEFEGGRRLGLFSGSTVFFGDEPGGVVAVSGSVPRLSGGLDGDGDLFEVEFTVTEPGSTTIEIDRIALRDITGTLIDSEPGTDVELDVE